MICGRCRATNRAGRRFCAECGASLALACEGCGFDNEPDERFCGGCGRRLPSAGDDDAPRAERRQVSVLFADLTGYTTLSSRLDPEEVHRILERFFDVADGAVARHGGSIDKHIGDNVMALFGAPVAHDDDPERAVRAALTIQSGVAELSEELGFEIGVHIGVATGEVVASSLGSRHHQAYTVTGNAVNLAARLQDKAKAGETLIDDAVRSAVADVAEATLVGDVEVKGLEEPVRVWKLVGLRAERQATQRAFVGRAAELARLRRALKECIDRYAGGVICLRGEPGIGKSRLAREILAEATECGARCLVALVLDFGAGRERDAIATLVRGVLDLEGDASAASAARGVVSDADVVFVCDLAGDDIPPEDQARFESMDDAAHGSGRKRALRDLLRARATGCPTLILIEDVHWADTETIDLLAAVAGSTADAPLLLLLTSRNEGYPLDGEFEARAGVPVTTLDLGPLGSDECAQLVASLATRAAEDTAAYVDRSGGNPLFLEQLLTTDAPTSQALPATLKSLVLARVDRLPRREQATVRAASVLGQRFDATLLQDVLELPPALDGLLARGLLRREAEDVVFAHALIRDGVYGSLTRAERRALHLAAARAVGSDELTLRAEHLDCAEHPTAAATYLEAASAEAARHHYHRALPLLSRASELADDQLRHAVLVEEGRVRLEIADGAGAGHAFGAALTCAPDAPARCSALIGAAAGHRLLSNYDAALDALARAEAIAVPAQLTRDLARLHYYRGNIYFPMGDAARCREEHARSLEYAERLGDGELQARAHSGLGDAAYTAGYFAEAEAEFRRCIELCRTHGLARFSSVNRTMLGHVLQIRGDSATALATMREALTEATSLSDRYSEMFVRQSLGLSLALTGELSASLRESELALALALELGARRYVPECESLLADVLFDLGDFDAAEQVAVRAVDSARATGLAYCGPMVLGILGLVTRDPVLRARCFEEGAMLLGKAVGAHNPLIFHRTGIDAAYSDRDAEQVLHHAAALDAWAQIGAARLASLIADRGRWLAARLQGKDEDPTPLAERARAMGVARWHWD